MTDTLIGQGDGSSVGSVVWPQDDGTGLSDGDEDYNSAGYLALMGQDSNVDNIHNGLSLKNVNTTSNTFDLEKGHAFVRDTTASSVQGGSDDAYDTSVPSGTNISYLVIIPNDVTSLSLDDDAVNHIWLAADASTNDSVYIRHGSSTSSPSDPNIKLGTIDSSDGTVSQPNYTGDFEELQNSVYVESVSTGSVSGTVGLDLSSENLFKRTLTGNTTFTFDNPSSSPAGNSFTLIVQQDGTGGHSITWPNSVEWDGGSPPSLSNNADNKHMLSFISPDGGTTWIGMLSAELIA